jgi:hypothetical protein
MAFTSLCSSDPLLDFIRSTYGAIPLRVPDQRFQPLALFVVQSRRARYLGTLAEIAEDKAWLPPRSTSNALAQVSSVSSNDIGWAAATEILDPFISSTLGIDISLLKADFSGTSKDAEAVRIVIGNSRRTMVNPFAIAHSIKDRSHRLLGNLSTGKHDIYIVDCVFVAKELTLELVGANSEKAAVSLEAKLVGKAKADQLLRANSKLTITGTNRTPFAFTCLKVKADDAGFIQQVSVGSDQPRLNAAPVSSIPNIPRAVLGNPNELLAFDE